MKEEWQSKKLGEICDIELGKTPSRSNASFWDEKRQTGNVWLSIADLLNTDGNFVHESKEYLSDKGAAISKIVRKGTLMVSFKLTLGRLAYAGCDLYTNEAIAALTIFDEHCVSKKFIFYFLHFFDWDQATEGDIKIKGRTLNKAKLKEILVHYPSLPEQQRIVAILDDAFESIAIAKANAEKNLQNAKALFDSYLQGEFAKAWQVGDIVTLADLATDITDGDHMPPPKAPSGVPFITIGNVAKDTRIIDFSDTFMVSNDYFNKLKPNKKPRKGDVLYTVTGSFGIPVLIAESRDFCFQRHIGLIRPKSDVDSVWLYYLLLSPQVFKQASDGATGTAQKTVSLKLLRGFQVPRIPLDFQQTVAAKLNLAIEETQRLESIYQQKITALDELKKALLHQAFSGQL
jgi:type I restriction enzyme S subunit